jgi:predicted RNA binding protein YcfA (HicA-like mRNA interferase family)
LASGEGSHQINQTIDYFCGKLKLPSYLHQTILKTVHPRVAHSRASDARIMARKRKLLRKILSGSRNVRFDEFVALIEAFGFSLARISGSHHIFSHPGVPQSISVQEDQNGQAKPYQLRQFIKLVEKYNLKLEDTTEDNLGE